MRHLLFIFLCCLAGAVTAQEDAVAPASAPAAPATETGTGWTLYPPAVENAHVIPRNKQERDQMDARAKKLKSDARIIEKEADQAYEASKTECWKQFLVSSCQEEARQVNRREEARANKMKREAKLIERNIRRYDSAERSAEREVENAKKDADIAKKDAEAKRQEKK